MELPTVEAAGLGLKISPSRIRLVSEQGEAVSGQVRVFNEGGSSMKILTDVGDTGNVRNKEGQLIRQAKPLGSTPYSCARWIQILQGEGSIVKPGNFIDLKFVLSPPENALSGGYAAYLFIRGVPEFSDKEKAEKQAELITIPRIGMSVFFEIQGSIRRTGEITKLDFSPPSEDKPLSIKYEFKNTGNAHIDLSGVYFILDDSGSLYGKGALPGFKSFPGDVGSEKAEFSGDIPPGKYKVLLTYELNPDGAEALIKEIDFEVK